MTNPPHADVISIVSQLAEYIDITKIMLVGARCRDIHQQKFRTEAAGRITQDIDFAIALENWDDFEFLQEQFPSSPKVWQQVTIGRIPVDLVPFGEIENPPGSIASNNGHLLNVAGFKEVFEKAELHQFSEEISIKVPTVPGFTGLKLHAWLDRQCDTTKDASDLALAMSWYEEDEKDENPHDTLWTRYIEMLDFGDFKREDYSGVPEAMAAQLLGIDTGRTLGRHETQALLHRFGQQSSKAFSHFAESLKAPREHQHPLRQRQIQIEAMLDGLRISPHWPE